jgi:hypothetical protein
MNMRETKLIAGIVLAASLAVTASAQTTVYNNTTTYQNQSVGLANLPAGVVEFGDELNLVPGPSGRTLSALKIEVFGAGLSGDEQATLHLYSIAGNLTNGYTLSSIGTGGPAAIVNGFNTLTYTDPALVLPANDKLVWTVSFTGVNGAERAELPIYNPPTVGSSLDDFWTKNGSGTFTLFRFPSGNPVGNFAANVTAVPEAGTIAYGLVGGLMVLGYLRLRRK